MPGMNGRSFTSPPRLRGATASLPAPYTYGQTAVEVDAIARGYRAAGYGIGHRVGLMLENRPFLHWFALNELDARSAT
jgi:hypothetical protein